MGYFDGFYQKVRFCEADNLQTLSSSVESVSRSFDVENVSVSVCYDPELRKKTYIACIVYSPKNRN